MEYELLINSLFVIFLLYKVPALGVASAASNSVYFVSTESLYSKVNLKLPLPTVVNESGI